MRNRALLPVLCGVTIRFLGRATLDRRHASASRNGSSSPRRHRSITTRQARPTVTIVSGPAEPRGWVQKPASGGVLSNENGRRRSRVFGNSVVCRLVACGPVSGQIQNVFQRSHPGHNAQGRRGPARPRHLPLRHGLRLWGGMRLSRWTRE